MQDSLICGQSIDNQNRLLGPSKANTYIYANQQHDGMRFLEDSCGGRAHFTEMDMMAGNGVVHKLSRALQSPTCRPLTSSNAYLIFGLPNRVYQSFIKYSWSDY